MTVVHNLKHKEPPSTIRFCSWMQQNLHDGLDEAHLLFITDKAYFHLFKLLFMG
jgi:hypothetical protein